MAIKEEWQADIVARDVLDDLTMISAIAYRLYPQFIYAQDRETELLKIPEMQRLAEICEKRAKDGRKLLGNWAVVNRGAA